MADSKNKNPLLKGGAKHVADNEIHNTFLLQTTVDRTSILVSTLIQPAQKLYEYKFKIFYKF